MSQFYDQASLVVVPSGYKAGTVYAQKPLTTDGQLAFTRTGDTATRVNSAGLIEKVRTNLVTYSEQFDNAAWTKSSATVTANTSVSPDGYTNADTLVITSGGYLLQPFAGYSAVSGQKIAMSIFAKNQTNGFLVFGGATPAGTDVYTIENYGNGWYRHSVVRTFTVTTTGTVQYIINTVGTHIIWGAQLEVSDFGATSYIPTTTAAVSVGPVANVPRLDYTGSTCPRLLLEPQRTNELQFSEQANNAYWSLFGATISANTTATLDPAGYYGADKLQEDTSTSAHTYGVSISGGSTTKTLSVFAKAAERNWAALRLYNGSASFFAYFNLSTGALGSVTAGATSTITSYGNGWYRCSITLALGAGTCEPNIYASTGNGTINYQGVTGSGIYVWGAQLEAGAYATSYIPTLAASATRGADACSKTSASALIGATAGTMFIEVENNPSAYLFSPPNNVIFASINSGDYLNNFHFTTDNASVYVYCNAIGGTLQAAIGTTLPTTATLKMAVTYTTSAIKFFLNGALVGTDTSFTLPSGMSRIDVGSMGGQPDSQRMRGRTNQFLLFKTALTDAQCIELTTL